MFDEIPAIAEESPEAALDRQVIFEADRLRAREGARKLVAAEAAAAGWSPPWVGMPSSLAEQFGMPRESPKWLIDRLLGWEHNAVLAAQHGTGKTTFGLNMVRSLVDGLPFLGREVAELDGRIGWINGEMDRFDWLDYARPMRIKAAARVAPMHLRDNRLPLINDYAAECFVKWCVEHDVKVLVLDSWRRLCAWCGVDENVNSEVEMLTARVDEIKRQAGISAFVALAHTGRARAEVGEERVRGATALDDWVDARWIMIKQPPAEGDKRFFWAEKRGVQFAETALMFDPLRYALSLGEGNRHEAADSALTLAVLVELSANRDGISTTKLSERCGLGRKTDRLKRVLRRLEKDNEVHSKPGKTSGEIWFLGAEKEEVSPSVA